MALLALNVYIAARTFVCEYIPSMGSIEAAYISLARYILDHPFDLTWFPLWYAGVPYENTYPPLMHLTTAAVAWLGDVSPAHAHHIVGGAMYCMGPVTLFWLALRLSGRLVPSFCAGLLYSLLSPSAFLIADIAQDIGGVWGPRRLHALAFYGEGPHVTALALLPVAILAVDYALERRRPLAVFGAALALAAVVLTNWLAAFALAIAVLALLTARCSADWRIWSSAAGIGALAYALASPWIPPGNIGDIRRNAQQVVGSYPLGPEHVLYAVLLAAAFFGMAWVLRRASVPKALGFGALFTLICGAIPLAADWTGVYLMPQPERYHLEMEMGLSLVIAFGAGSLFNRMPKSARVLVAALLVLGAVRQTTVYRRAARGMIVPFDITQTVEYEVAQWLESNLQGQRIFATGSIQFWLNAFADNPQVGGGFAQGIVNETIPEFHYGIPFLRGDGVSAERWLRAYGAQAVIVSGDETREAFPGSWRDSAKFAGVLPELWRSGDDVIYGVPQRSDSLAHTILAEDIVRSPPEGLVVVDPILAYTDALEDESLPAVEATWQEPGRLSLRADLEPEHLISVQVTCHEGWRAWAGARPVPIECDSLGFQVLEARCEDECEIELIYDGGAPALFARLASGGAFLFGIGWFVVDRRRRG